MRDYKALLEQFEKPFQTLLHILTMGMSGATNAFHVLQRIQSKQPLHWKTFTETLCQLEPLLEGKEQNLRLKPLFYLLPAMARRNLLSFLHLGNAVIPKDCLYHLIGQLRQNSHTDLWTQKLLDILEQDVEGGIRHLEGSVSQTQQLKSLCQKLVGFSEECSDSEKRLGWYFSEQKNESSEGTEDKLVLTQNPKKRKNSMEDVFHLDDGERNTMKKIKLSEDISCLEPCNGPEKQDITTRPETLSLESVQVVSPQAQSRLDISEVEQKSPPSTHSSLNLPEHVKACIPSLKDLFGAESDKLETSDELNIFNECDPSQILSLTEPASRFLMAAITSFCKKYVRPSCTALIGPLLQTPAIGSIQVKLICRLAEDCLEPEHLTVIFGHILSITWSEELLSVVHTLFERKVEVTPEQFEQFVQKLSQHAGSFSKSMKYAKVVLAALTKYQSYVTSVHKNMLYCILDLHKTFLKKSMQAALKHIVT
ncbi:Fanconi anemia group E protein isoform X2 [Chiloscyllium punctatum]|uniref:Fanconi anemia group E protein isoform X2 n=1 Tax=Chiloscyllium punctatum TaxID=137246 RepID=UPI003B63D88B